MHPVVRKLLALQEVDNRIARVKKKLDRIPAETASRRGTIEKLEHERELVHTALKEAELAVSEMELQVREIEANIEKQESHRDQAKNASTFAAAEHQLGYLRNDKEKLQEEQFGLMSKVEELTPRLTGLDAQLDTLRKEFAEYEGEAKKLEAELQSEIVKIREERQAHLSDIPAQNMQEYNDLFELRQGEAVVMVEADHCRGCYTRVTPNDVAQLQAASRVVTCKSCGRILYLYRGA